METRKLETAKIKVLKPFRDKFDKKVCYEVGVELEFEITRAADVVERELAEYADPIG